MVLYGFYMALYGFYIFFVLICGFVNAVVGILYMVLHDLIGMIGIVLGYSISDEMLKPAVSKTLLEQLTIWG